MTNFKNNPKRFKDFGKKILPNGTHSIASKVWQSLLRIRIGISRILNYHLRRRHLQEQYKQKINRIQSQKSIKLYFWRPHEGVNFGDEFGPEIIEKIFGYNVEYTPEILNADMISVGSILNILASHEKENNQFDSQIDVWGSGYIAENTNLNLSSYSTARIHAVRGGLTRARLPKKYQRVHLGDPALLANLVYTPSKKRNGVIGVLPHYIDKNVDIVKRMKKDKRFRVIDVLQSPQAVVSQITECDLILSSSLHGLITADAFGVPNIHLKLSNELAGQEYKFNDYYSALGEQYRCADLGKIFENDYLDSLKSHYVPVRGLKTIQDNLICSFPYKNYGG